MTPDQFQLLLWKFNRACLAEASPEYSTIIRLGGGESRWIFTEPLQELRSERGSPSGERVGAGSETVMGLDVLHRIACSQSS